MMRTLLLPPKANDELVPMRRPCGHRLPETVSAIEGSSGSAWPSHSWRQTAFRVVAAAGDAPYEGGFERAGCAEGVAGERFGGSGGGLAAEHFGHGAAFHAVVEQCAGAVQVDPADAFGRQARVV